MAYIAISRADDPRIEPFFNIRERDLVGRHGRFILEGRLVVELALGQSPCPIEAIFVAENRADTLADLLLPAARRVPVYVAPQAVMSAAVGFDMHRGVLALGRKPPPPDADELLFALPTRATVLVGVEIANHDNVGALFRNGAAFGASAILLDARSADPYYRKAIRVSLGHVLTMRHMHSGGALEHIERLKAHGFACIGLSPSATRSIVGYQRPDRLALVLGAEGPGLPRDVLSQLETCAIPMARGVDSLNVATAAAVALSHLGENTA
jgi:tRNA G18 (ribose-2'-O)-methylase SpoU